jgi:flagellar basal-body rod modification protein FlgD
MTTTTGSVSTTNPMSAEFLATVNPKTSESSSSMQLSENRFLTLLTTQLKNQDPLNPMDNAQMTSQMAQISTVEGIEKLNATLQKLMTSSTDSQAVQTAAMLGHQVLVAGNAMSVEQGNQAILGMEFPQSVDNATLTVRDANGIAIRTVNLGAQAQGLMSMAWDGKADSGEPVASGRYSFAVSAEQAGKPVTASTYQLATVTGVLREASGVRLELGQLGNFGLADIRQIF